MKYFIILISFFILSVLYYILREKTVYDDSLPVPEFFDKGTDELSALTPSPRANGIIIFDIPGLTDEHISDSLSVPNLYRISKNSRTFNSTVNLSTDRILSIKSFLECVPPYKIDDKKEPYNSYKSAISSSLRNSSLTGVFERENYRTHLFTADTLIHSETEGYFSGSSLLKNNVELIESLYKEIMEYPERRFIFFADLGNDAAGKNFFRNTDHLTGELLARLKERGGIEPSCLFISTLPETYFGKTVSILNGPNIRSSSDSTSVSTTDIAKTLLGHFKISHPFYFGGYDIENDDVGSLREFFAGSTGDTLYLFNERFIYKKLKYSPEYFYKDLTAGIEGGDSFTGINEKYESEITRYFGGDYIKYIIIRNRSESPKNFRLDIRSRRRFAELEDIGSYYTNRRENQRYSFSINRLIAPGEKDTVRIYYASMFQDFQYRFGQKYDLSYGASAIFAGNTDVFDENSYYGMKYSDGEGYVFPDSDMAIFNLRINY